MRRGLWALALLLAASHAAAETVTVAPGSVTVQMSPQELRVHRGGRGVARIGPEVRAASGRVRVRQIGDDNTAIVETQPGNTAMILQRGEAHTATVSQSGAGQGALVIQTGTGAATEVEQTTDGDRTVILQHSWQPRH